MSKQKNTAKKSKLPLIGALAAVIVITGVVAVLNFSSVARAAIERVASNTLGVPVTIGALDIDLQNKTVTAGGLRIGNPAGFAKPYAMSFDTISVAAESLSGEKLVFSEILVSGTDINIEVNETTTNLHAIKENVDRGAAARGPSDKPLPKVVIRTLRFEKASLNPAVTLTGGDMQSVVIPDITMNGIGERENGILVSEAMVQVLNHVIQVASRAAAKSGFFEGLAADRLKELGISSSVIDQIKGDVGKAIDGVKGLFGN